MKFGPLKVEKALGAILAHSAGGLKKGRVLSGDDVARLKAQGISEIIAARLTKADVPEDQAAFAIVRAICGPGAMAQAPFTGRANLHAQAPGLVIVDEALLTKLNRVHEAITVATLTSHEVVAARQMLATVKIIPYAAPAVALKKVLALLRAKQLVRVAAFESKNVGLVITHTPTTKPSLITKSETAIAERLARMGSRLAAVSVVPHETGETAKCIADMKARGLSPILVFGASAISDRADVVPAALKKAGGKVIHLGMPVDPGNLLMLGRIGKVPVVGAPTCARSPKTNGFDWVLNRLCAGLDVTREDVMAMGAGGLLAEISSRPQPREGAGTAPTRPRIAAIILAAGQSTRMGSNKLLADLHGRPLLVQTVEQVLASGVDEIVVVTGHMASEVQAALKGKPVRFVHNAAYAEGLATSVRTGIGAVAGFDAAFVCLGDMPLVRAEDMQRMMAAFDVEEGRTLIAPAQGRKLGNPVLWGQEYFKSLMALEGDRGARSLLETRRDTVVEIAVEHDGIMLDADTPEALAQIRALANS
jgi:molybdenum cofactor cytidylyltransferase